MGILTLTSWNTIELGKLRRETSKEFSQVRKELHEDSRNTQKEIAKLSERVARIEVLIKQQA